MSMIEHMKKTAGVAVLGATFAVGVSTVHAADMSQGANNFYKSSEVNDQEVRYKNAYGLEVVGTLFTPKKMENGKKYPALVVGHPYGAVREPVRIFV